ncbi:MAG TPA: ABC transporter substrate-binding protein [Solirubrobacterales bacterium]|nr:ABC transporter substrate-binding protein [Solirubrobacterales bacterium]
MRRALPALLAAALLLLLLPGSALAKAPRIVALTPFGANTLAKLGVKPVAVGQTLGGRERISPKLKGVTVLPLSHPNGPNLEQLASLEPDIVLSSPTWAKGNESMGDLGIKVVIREPRKLTESYSQMLSIGKLVGREQAAKELVKSLKKRVAQARQDIESRPRVMLILGVGRTPFVFLPNSWGGDLVTKAGGELLTGGVESDSGFERISDEVVVAENPDVIIAVPHAEEDDIPSLSEYLRTNPAWAGTNAVENDRIYISVDNSLLQAGTDVVHTIRKVRRSYLDNWPG